MSLLAAIGWKIVDRIGPVSPHGLGIAVGYTVGGMATAARAERLYGIKRDHIWNALMWAVLGVVVGSRLFYVAGHLGDYFPGDPLGIVRVWEGGLVFYGGAIGGILAALPYLRRNGIRIAHALDAAALGFVIGLIFGRIGDLVIGDHLGGPTDFFLGYRYDGGALPPGCPTFDPTIVCPGIGEVVHQTAIYDLISVLILLPIVFLLGRTRRAPGFMMAFTATLYAAGRLASDFTRPAQTYLGLRGTQWVSVAIILFCLWVMATARRREAAEPPPAPPEVDELLADEMISEGSPVFAPHDEEPPGRDPH